MRRSLDAGHTFELVPGTDRADTILAADARPDEMLLGNTAGEIIEVTGEVAQRERVCDGSITRVVYATSGPAAFVECDGRLFVRPDDTAAWRPFRERSADRIRTVVADPFDAAALYVGTNNGTYRWTAEESVRIAGPSDELRVVDLPTHTAIVSTHGGETVELAATTCSIRVDYYGGRSGGVTPTHNMSHLPSSDTFVVRASAPSCKWALDAAGAPGWMYFAVAGAGLPRKQIGFTGTVSLDVLAPRNTGYYRSGDFHIFWPYEIESHVGQSHRKDLCIHKPVSDDPTQVATLYSEGELLILKRYWDDAAVKSPRVIFKLKDSSGCPADGLLYGVTPAAAGTTIITTGVYQKGQPIVASMPFVSKNDKGEGAVYSLRGAGQVAPSAVATLVLPRLADLPPDLRISAQAMTQWGQTFGGFLAFGSTGGVVPLAGTVARDTKIANRRCAFDASLYRVAPSNSWLKVLTDGSGCTGFSSLDRGKIVISVDQNFTGSHRYGVVFTPWGWATLIVQN
ncbi:MAG TPA: hypothetical protein VFN10_19260 [Thermoanaerobaculia bacterium]|nr:hypothetical protein [Thermoanaerobaculia bacterium]